MQTIALCIEYDGTNFHGWQTQPSLRTIQSVLEEATSKVANHFVEIICAGRTDRGVHATEQIAHFKTNTIRDLRSWVLGINSSLPKDIRILSAHYMDSDFHARHSAILRQYRYIIYNSMTRPSLLRNNVTWCCNLLNYAKMHEAAKFWHGEHDFSSFQDSHCQSKTPFRIVKEITIKKVGDLVVFDIIANAFLHHMVRNMVGTLIKIGYGRKDVQWANEVLLAKSRVVAGPTAKASGLYLVKIYYPENFNLNSVNLVNSCKLGPWFLNSL